MDRPAGADDPEQAERLSAALRDTFAMLAAAPLPPEDKGRWQQRLIAITNSAKRDLQRADASLRRFLAEWERERR